MQAWVLAVNLCSQGGDSVNHMQPLPRDLLCVKMGELLGTLNEPQ